MIKREKNRKLRGSVLLTVVCVMSLLIVFLFGTLTLATAANNRAHVNYSTAQTGVTSRTVVDAAIKAMEANSTFGNAVSAIKKDDPSSEFEVNVQLGASVPNAGRYGDISPVSIEYAGQKKFYDSDSKQWIDGDIIRFTSTVSMAGNDSTTSAYIVKQPPGEGDKGGGGGAGFVTTAGADLSCQTNLYGGSYISLPKLKDGDAAGAMFYNYDYRTDSEYENNWNTSSSTYDPTLYRQFAPYQAGNSNTYFQLYNSSAFAETDLYVNNNMYIENWSGFVFAGEGKGMTIWGDMDCSTNAGDHLRLVFQNISNTDIKFNKIPYIYVDGTITGGAIPLGNASEIESEHYPLNIFCGSIIADGIASDKFKVDGDLYLMNENKTSIIKPMASRKLYSWVGSVINKAATGDGAKEKKASSIFSKGNLILGNMIIDGDVRVEGDCTISANTTIKGDLVVGGKLKIEGGAKLKFTGEDSKLYCDETQAEGLDAGIEADSKYKEVSTIEHSNPAEHPDAEKVENKHRYYLEYPAMKIDTSWGGTEWRGLLDEWGGSPDVTFYYKWKADFNPDDCEGHTFANYTDINEWNINGIDVKNWIEGSPYTKNEWGDNRPKNIDNNIEYYYVETVWDDAQFKYVTKSVPTDEREYYVNKNTHEKLTAYRTVPAFDGSDTGDMMSTLAGLGYDEGSTSVWYEIKTETIVSQSEAAPSAFPVNAITTYPDDIYPEYAERKVILGIETIPGISKEDTQIVKTMDEVLNTVANPYNYEDMSEEITSVLLNDNTPTFTDTIQIIENNKKVAVGIDANIGSYEVAEYTGKAAHGGPSWKKADGTTEDASNLGDTRAAVITENCILNLSTSDTGGKSIIIDPDGKEIYIIVKNLSIASSGNIIINDSNPGSVVNFYIYKDGSMNLDKTRLATTKYLSEMAKYNGQKMSYNSSDGDLKLEDLGKPRVNIYGGEGSTLSSSNTRLITANIISPNLKVVFSGSEGAYNFSNIYYDDIDIKNPDGVTSNDIRQYIIGCLNAKDVEIPNQLSVIYVTDESSDSSGGAGTGDNAFNYRILYYDEY